MNRFLAVTVPRGLWFWLTAACVDPSQSSEGTALEDLPPPARCSPGAAAMINGARFRTVQDAINALQPPATVTVCSGVHQEVDIRSTSAGPFRIAGETGNPADVVFDVGHQPSLFEFDAAAASTIQLDGVTIQNAGCGPGCVGDDAIRTSFGDHAIRLKNVIIEDADSNSGIVNLWAGTAVIRDSWFRRNRSEEAIVGIVAPSGVARPNVLIQGCTFEDNEIEDAVEVSVGGFGAFSRIQVRDSTFQRNTAESAAGVNIIAYPGDSLVEVSGSAFRENVVTNLDASPGLMLGLGDSGRMGARVTDTLFEDNVGGTASAVDLWGFGAYRGAGHAVGHAWMERTSFLRNEATGGGGGVVQTGSIGTWDVRYDDVEFGSGADDNVPFDLARCQLPLGFVSHGATRDLPPSDPCP